MGRVIVQRLRGRDLSEGLTATAADIAYGKTALVNGQVVTGSRKAVTKNLVCYAGEFSAKTGGTYYNFISPGFTPARVKVRLSAVPQFFWEGRHQTGTGTLLLPVNTDIVYAPASGEVKFAEVISKDYYVGVFFFLSVETGGSIRIKTVGDGHSGWGSSIYTCKIFGTVTFEP